MENEQVRHGEFLLTRVSPSDATRTVVIMRAGKRVRLGLGETGNFHDILLEDNLVDSQGVPVELLWLAQFEDDLNSIHEEGLSAGNVLRGKVWVEVPAEARVVHSGPSHDRHNDLVIPAGTYLVTRDREFDPFANEARFVMD